MPATMVTPRSAAAAVARRGEAVCWLSYGALGLSGGVLGPILPVLRLHLHVGYGGLALLFVAGSVGGGVATLVGNRLLDRLGYRLSLALGGAILAVVCLSRADVASFAVWVALSAVAGFASLGVDIGGIRYVAAAAEGPRQNAALNLLNVFYSGGALGAPLVVSVLAATGASVLWAYAVAGVCLLAVAATAAVSLPDGGVAGGGTPLLDAWRWALGQATVVRLALVIALYAGLEQAVSGWIASYGRSRADLPVAEAALLPLAFWGAMAVGRYASAHLARRWSEGSLVVVGTGATLLGLILALVVRDPAVIAVGAAVCGCGCGPIWPSVFALAARAAPDRHSEAYGLLYPAGSAGVLVAPWLTGQLFSLADPQAALAVPLGFAVVMAAVAVYVLAHDVARIRANAA